MRLIDADKLELKHYIQRVSDKVIGYNGTQPEYGYYDILAHDIANAPTVKAIPIEYIEAFKKKVRHIAPAKAVIDWLIENWEDEQARLFEKQITEECVSAERFADWGKENENRVE